MKPARDRLLETRFPGTDGELVLSLFLEDYSAVYPGMIRYTVCLMSGTEPRAVIRTNTYEYPPRVPTKAETVAREWFDLWKRELTLDPSVFLLNHEKIQKRTIPPSAADVVIIEGSPRADGNCSILTEWMVQAARARGKRTFVIYPQDMDINPCIGCYQCYNTGTCTFADDMTGIIDAIRGCEVLVVCSPVYTNTVPGMLKVLIDRCQAYHAERLISGGPSGQRGLLLAVAGRTGQENFACVKNVVLPFMRNLGIEPSGECLFDGTDILRDLRSGAGLRELVLAAAERAINDAKITRN